MPLGKLWPNRRGAARARGVITSELGQKRRLGESLSSSFLPLKADILRKRRHVSKVPETDFTQSPHVNEQTASAGTAKGTPGSLAVLMVDDPTQT